MIVPPTGAGNRRCGGLQPFVSSSPHTLPCSSLPTAGGTNSKLSFSGQRKLCLRCREQLMTLPTITEVLPGSCSQLPQRLMLSASVSPKVDALGQRELIAACSSPLTALPHLHKVAQQVAPQARAAGAAEAPRGEGGRMESPP